MEQNRNRGSPRLLFSKEELDNPALSRPAKKAAKAADKYEAAQKKLPTRHRLPRQQGKVRSYARQNLQRFLMPLKTPEVSSRTHRLRRLKQSRRTR